MDNIFFYDTLIGRLAITDNNTYITSVKIVNENENKRDFVLCETELIKRAAIQLFHYLNGKRKKFDLPLKPNGTEFQRRVWNVLCEIPYGETRSYKQIAIMIGNPNSSRAIGMANNKNPIMIFIPCHRVLGSDGSMTGYAGGIDIKEKLISLECSKLNRRLSINNHKLKYI